MLHQHKHTQSNKLYEWLGYYSNSQQGQTETAHFLICTCYQLSNEMCQDGYEQWINNVVVVYYETILASAYKDWQHLWGQLEMM
jgi:hypothetical protein